MKKLLAMLVVLSLATVANATVIDVVARDIGLSEGRTGGIEDPLLESDIVGIVITTSVVLDAYDLDLHVTGPGTLSEIDGGPGAEWKPYGEAVPVWQALNRQDPGFIGNDTFWLYSGIVGGNSIAQMSWAWLEAQMQPGDLIWGLAMHCDGPGEILIDLTQGLGTTGSLDPTVVYGEADLGDLVIYQIPEPITMIMLGLGGLGMLRRRR